MPVISKHSLLPPHTYPQPHPRHSDATIPERVYTNNAVAITHPLVRRRCPGRGPRWLPVRRRSLLVRTVVPLPMVVPLPSDDRRTPNRPCRCGAARGGSSPSRTRSMSASAALFRAERPNAYNDGDTILFTILSYTVGNRRVISPAKTFDYARRGGPTHYAP